MSGTGLHGLLILKLVCSERLNNPPKVAHPVNGEARDQILCVFCSQSYSQHVGQARLGLTD